MTSFLTLPVTSGSTTSQPTSSPTQNDITTIPTLGTGLNTIAIGNETSIVISAGSTATSVVGGIATIVSTASGGSLVMSAVTSGAGSGNATSTIASMTPTTPVSLAEETQTPSVKTDDGLSTGTIIGLAAGLPVAGIIIVFLFAAGYLVGSWKARGRPVPFTVFAKQRLRLRLRLPFRRRKGGALSEKSERHELQGDDARTELPTKENVVEMPDQRPLVEMPAMPPVELPTHLERDDKEHYVNANVEK